MLKFSGTSHPSRGVRYRGQAVVLLAALAHISTLVPASRAISSVAFGAAVPAAAAVPAPAEFTFSSAELLGAGPMGGNAAWGNHPVPLQDAGVDSKDLERLAATALAAFEAANYADAIQSYSALIQADPSASAGVDAELRLGFSYFATGNFSQSISALDRWIAQQPESLQLADDLSSADAGNLNSTSAASAPASSIGNSLNRRQSLASALLYRARATYQNALLSNKLTDQILMLDSAKAQAEMLAKRRPGDQILSPAKLLSLMAIMQQLARETSVTHQDWLTLAQTFEDFASSAADDELKFSSIYYQAICLRCGENWVASTAVLDSLVGQSLSAELAPQVLLAAAENRMRAAIENQDMIAMLTPAKFAPNLGASSVGLTQGNGDDSQNGELSAAEAQIARTKLLTEAGKLYQELMVNAPLVSPEVVAFNLGVCYRMLGQPQDALPEFEKLVVSQPTGEQIEAPTDLVWNAAYNRARCHFALEAWGEAANVADSAIDNFQLVAPLQRAEAVLLRLRIAHQDGDQAKVAELSSTHGQLLSLLPNSRQEIRYLAALSRAQADNGAAADAGLAELEKMAGEMNNEYATLALYNAAALRHDSGQDLARQVAARPVFDEAEGAQLKSELSKCAQHCRTLLDSPSLNQENFPANPEMLNAEQRRVVAQRIEVQQWLAEALYGLTDFSAAAEVYRQLYDQYPQASTAGQWLVWAAKAFAAADQHSSTVALLTDDRIKGLEPEWKAQAYFSRGKSLAESDQAKLAAQSVEQAIFADDDSSVREEAIPLALYLYNETLQPIKVIDLANRLELDTTGLTRAALRLYRGTARFNAKKFVEAKEDFSQCLELLSTLPASETAIRTRATTQFNLGLTHLALSEKNQAREAFLTFLQDNPQDQRVAEAVVELKKLDPTFDASAYKSARNSSKAPLQDSSDPPLRSRQVRETAGADSEARNDNTATGTDGKTDAAILPETVTAAYDLGKSLMQQQQWSDAVRTFERLYSIDPDPSRKGEYLLHAGWAKKQLDQTESSQETFRQLVQEHPESPFVAQAKFHLGEFEYADENYVNAATLFRTAAELSPLNQPKIKRSSLYLQAWSEYKNRSFEVASQSFADLASQFSGDPLADEARLMSAQSLFMAKQFPAAVQSYVIALEKIQESSSVKETVLWQNYRDALRAAVAAGQFDQAKMWLAQWNLDDPNFLVQHPDVNQSVLDELWYQAAVVHQNLDQAAIAKTYFKKLAALTNQLGARSLSALGGISKIENQLPEASRFFTALANGSYGENPAPEIRKLQAEATYQQGVLLLSQASGEADFAVSDELKNQAKRWFTRAAQQMDSLEIAQQARQQLEQLR